MTGQRNKLGLLNFERKPSAPFSFFLIIWKSPIYSMKALDHIIKINTAGETPTSPVEVHHESNNHLT